MRVTDAVVSSLVPEWPVPGNVGARVIVRKGPAPSPEPGVTARDGTRWRDTLSLPSEPCWLRQVHGVRVARFDALPTEVPEADAAVTRTPGVVLAIRTADCLPVLFCARDGSEIAAAHAGWRGLSAGVLENTLAAMRAPRGQVLAWLGPAIARQSYEVGDEVRDAFLAHAGAARSAFSATRPGHWMCDLYALARQRLRAAGLVHISGGGFDTFADARFHSYRRDGAHGGRIVSLAWIAPAGG